MNTSDFGVLRVSVRFVQTWCLVLKGLKRSLSGPKTWTNAAHDARYLCYISCVQCSISTAQQTVG